MSGRISSSRSISVILKIIVKVVIYITSDIINSMGFRGFYIVGFDRVVFFIRSDYNDFYSLDSFLLGSRLFYFFRLDGGYREGTFGVDDY